MKTINILLSGVGGQGVILASRILSEAALAAGPDIKQSEVHGMSQRGGSVVSHVRIGESVHSPLVPEGQCDILVGFEPLEGCATPTACATAARSSTPSTGSTPPPSRRASPNTPRTSPRVWPPTKSKRFPCPPGNSRSARATAAPPTWSWWGRCRASVDFSEDVWQNALEASIPAKILALNREAFRLGREAVC